MTMLTALRKLDPQDILKSSKSVRLINLGYQPHYGSFLAHQHYVRFDVLFEDSSEMTGVIDAMTWVCQTLPSIEGIDWSSLDEQVLCSLIPSCPLRLDLKAQHSPIASIKIIELVRDVSGLTSLPRLNASSSIVFVERFDYGDSTAYPHAEKSQRLEHGVLTCVEFVAGYTKFPIGSLSKIEIGDVLLIDNTVFRVSCSGRALFTYTLNQGSIMIEEQIQIEDQHFMQQDARYTEQPINLDDIPVELSFVLMEKSIPFSELKTFAPGEVIALPQEQVMRVEIRANQRSIGRGELVQLTNGQLAVEIRQLLL